MPRAKTHFVCSECGTESAQWLGKCPACESWNTLAERALEEPSLPFRAPPGELTPEDRLRVTPLSQISLDDMKRFSSGFAELDRLLGGGFLPQTSLLLAGDPGIGKSTLALQVACAVARSGLRVLYVAAEESVHQVKERAVRIGAQHENLFLVGDIRTNRIPLYVDELEPALVIVDSIQAVCDERLAQLPGTLAQVRESGLALVRLAREKPVTLVLVGHITKEGQIAGPKALEHLVDVVFQFEGDLAESHRLIRSAKNRHGATGEVAVFEMKPDGLAEVRNPSQVFFNPEDAPQAGRATGAHLEGSRAFLFEMQALVVPSSFETPTRRAMGVSSSRVALFLAVLEKSLGIGFGKQDVFIKTSGGLEVREPGCDLALVAAVLSSVRKTALSPKILWAGEVGLAGEVRRARSLELRMREAARLGVEQAVVPVGTPSLPGGELKVFQARGLEDIYREFFR